MQFNLIYYTNDKIRGMFRLGKSFALSVYQMRLASMEFKLFPLVKIQQGYL